MVVQRGDRVELLAYGGELIVRRVVAVNGRSVEVCTEEMWSDEVSGRTCRRIGFRLADIVRVLPASTAAEETTDAD